MLNIVIDGQSVQVEPGTTLMEAARATGIEIPHLCYHPDLSISGGCRLCVVEVEGRADPVPSCGQACQEGMVIHTQSEQLTELRLTATEFGVLAALFERPGVVLSRGQLMQRAYPFDNLVTERTLDTHVRRIRAKFRALGRDPIETVHGVGYKAAGA